MLSRKARQTLEAKHNVLRAATEVIRKPENWCKGARDNGKGAHCAMGAVGVALKAHNLNHPGHALFGPIVADLAANTPIPASQMARDPHNSPWNDTFDFEAPGNANWKVARYNNTSTHEQVLAWFENTANGMKCILDRDDAELDGAGHG